VEFGQLDPQTAGLLSMVLNLVRLVLILVILVYTHRIHDEVHTVKDRVDQSLPPMTSTDANPKDGV
jgi:fumarate reductase subunit D